MDELDLGATIRGFVAGQKLFGRYTLLRQLGRGGMGVVWRARDDSLERDVAIKMLPEMVANDPASVRELKRETSRNQQLSHPHILRVYDFAEGAGLCGITMEIAEGGTLTSRRLDQPGEVFEPAHLGPWLRQLCEALDYAHQRGKVVHRDLKPANLMLTADDELKVTDFGIAASLSESVTRVSKQAGSSGTPVYMSPQQMMGDKPAVTDDIYALGATLYELLTGKPPFYAGNILLQVQSKKPLTLAERRNELGVTGEPIPAEWEQTIAACLAKEPKDRPQSAGEVGERLGVTTKDTKVTKPSGKAGRSDEPRKADVPSVAATKRKPAAFMPMVIAAVFGLGGLGWYFGVYAPEQKRLAEEARAAAAAKENQDRITADLKDRQEKAAAEAKAKAEEEQKIYTEIAAKIDAFSDGSPADLRASTDAAVKSYLAVAPARYRAEIQTRWIDRQAGWEAARKREEEQLTAQRQASINRARTEYEQALLDFDRSFNLWKARLVSEQDKARALTAVETALAKLAALDGQYAGKGMAYLTASPSTATIRVGELSGVGKLVAKNLAPGSHTVSVELAGYKRSESVISIQTGRFDVPETIVLEKEVARQPQPGQPWENSLGQKFVPVPGTDVLFCIWETRERDYAAFAQATGRNSSNINAGMDHPAGRVSWEDARAFCQWLTEKERREGVLADTQSYRLPLDAEWSTAVGLNEPGMGTVSSKDTKIRDRYPWGTQWPPPQGAGNYDPSLNVDTFERTSPVGTFAANQYGIYDLGGNVWEWCEDLYDANEGKRVLRGASFFGHDPTGLLSSARYRLAPWDRDGGTGFRMVVSFGNTGALSPVVESRALEAGKPVVGQKWTIPDLKLDLMPIAPGTFQMGRASGGESHERPATLVTITKPYWLGKTEVTNAQWTSVMGYVAGLVPNLPAGNVNWNEAVWFCQRLTERERKAGRLPEGYAYTLPTEAQWEYACRAGSVSEHGGDINLVGWYRENSGNKVQPVGQKKANAWGLHDMHGNVREWCLDWYGPYPGGNVSDPTGPTSGTHRITRGLSVGFTSTYALFSYREWSSPQNRDSGFRIALVITDAAPNDRVAQSGSGQSYTVRAGDTIARIAVASGVSIDELLSVNPVDPAKLRVGQVLNIPNSKAAQTAAVTAEICVSVVGQVGTPGQVTLARGSNILAAVSKTGGFTQLANRGAVKLTRISPDGRTTTSTLDVKGMLEGRIAEIPILEEGDVIFVPERLI